MKFLQADNVDLFFADRIMLDNAKLRLASGCRYALSGPNGSGKTTLLRALCHLLETDGGEIRTSPDTELAYLPQSGIVAENGSVLAQALMAYKKLDKDWERRQELALRLEVDPEGSGSNRMIEEIHELDEKMESTGYHDRETHCGQVLTGLGFHSSDFSRPAKEFSGGWQMRMALAKVLLEKPDFLLLDEPTNYLDLESIAWLETFLKGFPGGILMVSHDRDFLNRCITGVFEIFHGEVRFFPGNYDAYEAARKLEIQQMEKNAQMLEQEKKRVMAFVERFRYKATKAAQVQSRLKHLEKMEEGALPPEWRNMRIRFPDPPHCGREVIRIKGLGKSYGEKTIFSGLEQTIRKGERWVLLGANGTGKSTLMSILAGKNSPTQGRLELGSGVVPAYFSQDQDKALDPKLTVYEEALKTCPRDQVPQLRGRLGSFLFSGEDIDKKVGVLSGGEKNRLALLKMLLVPANLYLLDEPTNHLDLASKDLLLKALQEFTGTVVFVSHDSYFIRKLANQVLLMRPRPVYFPGDYAYYMEKNQSLASGEEGSQLSSGGSSKSSGSQQSRQAKKDHEARLRRARREEETLMQKAEESEIRVKRLEEEIQKPEIYSDGMKSAQVQLQLEDARTELEEINQEWERSMEALEALESKV